MDIYVKKILQFPYFLFFWFSITILSYTLTCTRIAASNTASDRITNKVTHRIFNTNLYYSYVHFIIKNDKNIVSVMFFLIRFNDAY